jgi:hypothetical protein
VTGSIDLKVLCGRQARFDQLEGVRDRQRIAFFEITWPGVTATPNVAHASM